MQRSWIELCAQPVNQHILRLADLVEHRRACWHCQSASIWSGGQLASTFSPPFNMLAGYCRFHMVPHGWPDFFLRTVRQRAHSAHVRGLTYAAPVPTAATTTIPSPMIVDGSPPVRRRAAAGVASTCLLPSTEVRTGARSDPLAILVATFLPDICSCVAVERSPGPLLGFRCRALARSRSRLATLRASLP